MKSVITGVSGAALVALCGCTVAPPTGPSVMAMAGQGKTFEQFQADDGTCRSAAFDASGGNNSAQAATGNALGTAAIGTALGAAAGALIGSAGAAVGGGAAVGAGIGLLAGSAVGANGAQASTAGMQQRYDMTYIQCMASKGEQVPQFAANPYPAYPYYYGPGYYYYPRYYGYSYRY
jgi:hypothetical protein